MRKLGLVFFVAGVFGCSDNDVTVTPTANGVFPAHGFIGRKAHVEISGDSTTWSSAATVSFGDGITVDKVTLASPTDLFADITVMPTAALGMRDVTVSDGGKTFTLAQAFELTSPISVKFQGSLAQGSVPVFTITNHDFDNPFDDTSTGDGLFTPITYTNLSVNGPTGMTFQVNSVTPFKATGIALIDVDATSGGTFDVLSGPAGGDLVDSPFGEKLDIATRTPVALTSGMAMSGMLAHPYDTQLYSIQTAAPALSQYLALGDDPNAAPNAIVLGGSGHFATDFVDFGPQLTEINQTSGVYYVIYWDNGGTSGYQFTVKATDTQLHGLAENDTANNATATAQALTMPALLQNASLATGDKDWMVFTVTTAMVGKHVHVTTTGDHYTDTVVDVFTATKVSQAQGDLYDGSTAAGHDQGYQEDIDSTAIPTGTTKVYVRITPSSYFDPNHSQYVAAVYLD